MAPNDPQVDLVFSRQVLDVTPPTATSDGLAFRVDFFFFPPEDANHG